MSAAARDYVYEVVIEEDDEPIPAISHEELDAMAAEAAKYFHME